MELFKLMGTIAVDNSKAMAAITQTTQYAGKSKSKLAATFASIGKSMVSVGKNLTSHITKPALVAGTALAGITLAKGWARMTEIDNARVKLTALGHSGDSVKEIMNNALASVKGTAYGLDEAATTAASAVASGIEKGKPLENYLKTVADTASVAGVSMADMGSIFNKVAAKGKVDAEILNQLSDAGVPALQLLADQLGVTSAEVADLVSKGEVDFATFQAAMQKGMDGAAVTMGSKTITGAISNISASIGRIGANFLGSADDANSFAGRVLPLLNEFMGWLGKVEDKAAKWGATFGEVFGAVIEYVRSGGESFGTLSSSAQSVFNAIQPGINILMALGSAFMGMSIQGKVAFLTTVIAAGPLLTLFGNVSLGISRVINAMKKMQSGIAALNGARAAVLNYQLATDGASLSAAVANGELTKQQVMLGTLGNKFTAVTAKIHGFIVAKVASAAAVAKDTAVKVANAVATSAVGVAASSAAKKVLLFATAHTVAFAAVLGIAGVIAALAVGLAKCGGDADLLAAKITGFADRAANSIARFAEAFPGMVDGFVTAFTGVVNALTAALPTMVPALVDAGIQLFLGLVQALTQIIEPLVAELPQVISAIVGAIPVLIPALIEAGITLFMALVEAIPQIIPPLVEAIPQIINAIVQVIPVLVPTLLQGAIQLFMAFVQAIPQIVPPLVAALPQIISAVWNGLVVGLQVIWEAIKAAAGAAWESLKATAMSAWEAIKTAITSKIDAAKARVGEVVDSIKTKTASAWNGIKSTASSVWNSIKTAITKPVETARDTVKKVIDKMKGFFNFSWSLPKLKLPHLSIKGKFNLVPPSVPSFSIKWYKKAMENAMLLNGPTIFGMSSAGQMLGGGEAGQEVVAGSQTLMQMIKTVVAEESGGTEAAINRLIDLLSGYLPEILAGQDKTLVLDTGELVENTADKFYKKMGEIAAGRARRGMK